MKKLSAAATTATATATASRRRGGNQSKDFQILLFSNFGKWNGKNASKFYEIFVNQNVFEEI